MDLRSFSGLTRPLDLAYPTNRWIAGLAGAVLAIGWLGQGVASGDWVGSGGWAVGAALAVFLGWALCRELDPDRDLAAFVAAGLSLLGLALFGLPGLAALFVVLLAVRVLNRTTGSPATWLDGFGLLGLGAWLALDGAWLYLIVGATALILDGVFPPRELRRLLVGVVGAAVAAVVLLSFGAEVHPAQTEALAILLGAGLAAPFIAAIRGAGAVEAIADDTGVRLASLRVRAGQVLALAVGLGAVAWDGFAGLATLAPLWAAMAAAGGYRLVIR